MQAKNTLQADEPVVYFIQAEHGGPIKIGYSARFDGVGQRLTNLQTGNPHRLIVRRVIAAPLGAESERALHRRFAMWRMAGEWFMDDPELVMTAGAKLPKVRDHREIKRTVQAAYAAGRHDGIIEVEERTRNDMREFFGLAGRWFSDDETPEWPAMFHALRQIRGWHGLNISSGSSHGAQHGESRNVA